MSEQPYIIIDAGEFTGNYNNCLLEAMGKRSDIYYAATVSPYVDYPHPSNIKVVNCFFLLARLAGKLTSSNFVRRLLRAVEYPFDLFVLFLFIFFKGIKVVHIMWLVIPSIDLWYIKLLQLSGKRVVLTAHNPFPHEFKQKHLNQYSLVYNQVNSLITLTEYSKQEIIDNAGIEKNKITVIPHGDLNYVLSHFPINEDLAKRIKLKAKKKWIVSYFGHLRPYKGVEYFIKAIPLIKKLNPSTFFIIAGSPRFANEAELKRLITENCDPSYILCDLRFVPTADMKTYFSLTNVLVQPYISASQSGNTVMAYAAGIPVISTNVGGLAEMIEDGKTGYVIAPRDPEAIADAVAKCFDGDSYEKMSHNSRLAATEQYSWGKIAEQTAIVYRNFGNTIKKELGNSPQNNKEII